MLPIGTPGARLAALNTSSPMLRFVPILCCATLAIGCKKEKNEPAPPGGGSGTGGTAAQVQFTINGDGFSDQTITINPAAGSGTARFSNADNETTGIVMADANNSFQVIFPGNATGTFTCTGGVGALALSLRTNGQLYINQTNTATITTYGAVGGWIEGTWSGTILRANGASAGTAATITNGTFRFRRSSDM